MCDYSLQNVKSRSAAIGDKLHTRNFGTGTTGFCDTDGAREEMFTAVCLLPGTELAFDVPIQHRALNDMGYVTYAAEPQTTEHTTAIFRQINKEHACMHHDCLEFPDGKQVLLTLMLEGQHATVLQLPAAPKTAEEAKEQERLAVAA